MKTKFFLTLAIALTVATVSQAQTTFGIRGGVNMFNLNGDNADGSDLDNKLKVGFNAGFNAEIPVGTDFYLQPGVLFSQKGAKFGDDGKLNLSYVEVPVNFLYKPELGAGKMLLGFGPYFGVAVGGSYKVDGVDGDVDIEFENDATLLTAPYTLKRYDAGGNLLVGYEFANKLSFQLNAQLGMLNIAPKINGEETDYKVKNTGFGLSLGYRF
ncbi:MAG: PorT family protein [Chitinophagaceae bacterium]|nr:MAG: PorT family protein [Chitinophagaceae bacterium]